MQKDKVMIPNPSENPYLSLPLKYGEFYGSQYVLETIKQGLSHKQPVTIELIGLRGMGKSSLMKYISSNQFLQDQNTRPEGQTNITHLIFPIYINFSIKPSSVGVIQFIYQTFLEAAIDFSKSISNIENLRVDLSKDELDEIINRKEILTHLQELITHQQLVDQESAKPAQNEPDAQHLNTEYKNKIIRNLLGFIQRLSLNDIRPVFLLDNFNLVIDDFTDVEINQLMHWRHYCWFIIGSEQRLKHKEDDAGTGSKLFGQVNPIYLSGLNNSEIKNLLTKPLAENQKNIFSEEDQKLIQDVVGNHTYFLIVAAKILWDIKTKYPATKSIKQEQKNLFVERTYLDLKRMLDTIWKSLLPEEQKLLKEIAKPKKFVDSKDHALVMDLLNQKGLVQINKKDRPEISELFRMYINQTPLINQEEKTDTEKRIYDYFLASIDAELSFQQIWCEVWPDYPYNEDSKKRVQVHVSRLRSKLDPDREEIHSLRQIGYKYTKKGEG